MHLPFTFVQWLPLSLAPSHTFHLLSVPSRDICPFKIPVDSKHSTHKSPIRNTPPNRRCSSGISSSTRHPKSNRAKLKHIIAFISGYLRTVTYPRKLRTGLYMYTGPRIHEPLFLFYAISTNTYNSSTTDAHTSYIHHSQTQPPTTKLSELIMKLIVFNH